MVVHEVYTAATRILKSVVSFRLRGTSYKVTCVFPFCIGLSFEKTVKTCPSTLDKIWQDIVMSTLSGTTYIFVPYQELPIHIVNLVARMVLQSSLQYTTGYVVEFTVKAHNNNMTFVCQRIRFAITTAGILNATLSMCNDERAHQYLRNLEHSPLFKENLDSGKKC